MVYNIFFIKLTQLLNKTERGGCKTPFANFAILMKVIIPQELKDL
jgi:hypothetical protein